MIDATSQSTDLLHISSTKNPAVQDVKALHKTQGRKKAQRLLVETPKPVAEALKANLVLETLYVLDSALVQAENEHTALTDIIEQVSPSEAALVSVTESVMKAIATTQSPPPVLGVFKTPDQTQTQTLDDLVTQLQADQLWLVLDGLQDPGNVGTLIRSAKAFGATGIITTTSTADVYQPKVIRSTAGLVFSSIVFENLSPENIEQVVANASVPSLVFHLLEDRDNALDYTDPALKNANQTQFLVVGSEGHGLSDFWQHLPDTVTTQSIRIPMAKGVESLNASVAGSVVLAHTFCK